MNSPTHTIDPDGEVIIILRNANSPFAQMDENSIPSGDSDIFHSLGDNAQDYPAEDYPAEDYPAEDYSDEEAVAEDYPAEDPAAEEAAADGYLAELPVQGCFRIQVSAKHLMFASPIFKKILTGGWKESITYLQKGSVEVTAESWDIEALLIVLRAIHGQYNLIPKKLTLEMLAKVAVIADYYECKNVLYLLTDRWINNLKEKIPATVTRGLILWLWIAWFFKLPSQFKLSTSIAMSLSNGWIDDLGLPIPGQVIGSMNEGREVAIKNLIVLLHETRDAFIHGSRGCCFECRALMYGALTMRMESIHLLSPKPETPFLGLNHSSLVQKVMEFTSPRWYDAIQSGYSAYRPSYVHSCSDSSFASVFAILKDPLEGLELNRFTSS
ncbi:hypothetical protein N7486_007965 [Penicillium sp. IBT 16267x]|nr:hypothetical protein N7486_007965 [Penicillium sp. IBT 16267x]